MKKLLITTAIIGMFFISCDKDTDITNSKANNISPTLLNSENAVTEGYTLIFEDQFNGNSIDDKIWEKTCRPDFNSVNCIYVPKQSSIASLDNNSCLRLQAIKDSKETPCRVKDSKSKYKSGHVKSKITFEPQIDEEIHIKARIKFLASKGKKNSAEKDFKGFDETSNVWPAFWTVNETEWPLNGEIDIMEGYSFGNSDEETRFSSNLFFGTAEGTNDLGNRAEREWKDFDINSNEGWHTYELFWKNDNESHTLTIKIDNETVAIYNDKLGGNDKSKIIDFSKFTDHSVIFNLNVGSNPDINIFDNNTTELFDETSMYVDYVIVEKKNI